MRTVSRSPGRTLLPLLFLCCFGCARPIGNDDASAKSRQPVPFRDALESGAQTTSSASTLAVPQDGSTPARGVPFHPQNLPAGTLLSVRLNESVSTGSRGQSSTFTASLDEPIVIDGRTVVASGANVSGRVESSQSSSPSDGHGYLCLRLDSIEVGGRDLSLRTSILFAKGTTGRDLGRNRNGLIVRVEQGRHLTFRLTEPLPLSGQVAISSR